MVKRHVELRPWAGPSTHPFDAQTFTSPLSGMNGRLFSHVVITDFGEPGRRQALRHCTSLERAVKAVERLPAVYFERGAEVWGEELP
jgi:hypothetical protein